MQKTIKMNAYNYFLIWNGFIIDSSSKLLELVNNWNKQNDALQINYITVYSNLQNSDYFQKILYVDYKPNILTIQKILFHNTKNV